MKFKLFSNVGKKIQITAIVAFFLEALGSVAGGIFFLAGEEEPLIGTMLIVLGPLVSLVINWFIYGYGVLIINSSTARIPSDNNEKANPDIIPATISKNTAVNNNHNIEEIEDLNKPGSVKNKFNWRIPALCLSAFSILCSVFAIWMEWRYWSQNKVFLMNNYDLFHEHHTYVYDYTNWLTIDYSPTFFIPLLLLLVISIALTVIFLRKSGNYKSTVVIGSSALLLYSICEPVIITSVIHHIDHDFFSHVMLALITFIILLLMLITLKRKDDTKGFKVVSIVFLSLSVVLGIIITAMDASSNSEYFLTRGLSLTLLCVALLIFTIKNNSKILVRESNNSKDSI